MKPLLTYLHNATKKLTAIDLAHQELAQAQIAQLEAQTTREYADAMVTYNTARITRLQRAIAAHTATKG
jgi:hypothetical protein